MKIHAGLFIVCSIAVAFPAAADDRKAYHGSECQQATWPGNIYRDPVYGVWAVNLNGTSVGTGVTCGLIRDRLEVETSVNGISIEGYNAGGTFTCWVYSQTEDSSSGTYYDWDSHTSYDVGRFQLDFFVDSTHGSTAGNEGSYAAYCFMPAGSMLHHIQVDEDSTGVE